MLDQLIARSREYDERKTDFGPAPVTRHKFHPQTAQLLVPIDEFSGASIPLQPTGHAFRQICQKLGPACFGTPKSLPSDYLANCPAPLRAEQLNHWLTQSEDERQWFVRGYDDQCRAVLSERYITVDVTETLDWIKEALNRGTSASDSQGVVIHNAVVTPDVLHIRVFFREVDTPGGHYAIGGYFTTGEVGNRRLGAYPLIQRTSCINSIAIPQHEYAWEHIHTGTRSLLRRLFIDSIFVVLGGAVEALDRFLDAEGTSIPSFTDYVDSLVQQRGWTSQIRDRIILGSEGRESLFGLVNGISYAAQRLDNPDARADMELAAGGVLYARLGK